MQTQGRALFYLELFLKLSEDANIDFSVQNKIHPMTSRISFSEKAGYLGRLIDSSAQREINPKRLSCHQRHSVFI